MSVGVIFLGMLIGAAAGITGLILGLPVWMALLIYAGVGSLTICVWIAVLMVIPRKRLARLVTDG